VAASKWLGLICRLPLGDTPERRVFGGRRILRGYFVMMAIILTMDAEQGRCSWRQGEICGILLLCFLSTPGNSRGICPPYHLVFLSLCVDDSELAFVHSEGDTFSNRLMSYGFTCRVVFRGIENRFLIVIHVPTKALTEPTSPWRYQTSQQLVNKHLGDA
jgi:hypothetical protein